MTGRFTSTLGIDLAGGAGVLAIAGLTAVLGVMPAVREQLAQQDRAAQLASIEIEIATARAETDRLAAQKARSEAQAEQNRLRLLSRDQLNTRIAGLIETTERHGLEVIGIQPGETVQGDIHTRTRIDIAITGGLPDVVRYLHAMRRDTADLIVRRLEIRPVASGDGVTTLISADWLTSAG